MGPWSRQRDARTDPLEAAYTDLLDDPDALLAVGTIDDVVLGFAAARIETLHDSAPIGVVTDLCPFMALPNASWFHRLHGFFRQCAIKP